MRGGGGAGGTCVLKDPKGEVVTHEKGQTTVISCFCKQLEVA